MPDMKTLTIGGITFNVDDANAVQERKLSSCDFTNFLNGSFTEVVDGETITHTVAIAGNTITIDGIVFTFPAEV